MSSSRPISSFLSPLSQLPLLSTVSSVVNQRLSQQTPFDTALLTLISTIGVSLSVRIISQIREEGIKKYIFSRFMSLARILPGAGNAIEGEKNKIIGKLEEMLTNKETQGEISFKTLPAEGMNVETLLSTLNRWQEKEEKHWNAGQVSGGIYHGGKELLDTLTKVYGMFALANPLHPDVFPFIRKMEAEVISMSVALFQGDPKAGACGTMTAGGTESILMAMKSYRDQASKNKGIQRGEIIAPTTAHAAFNKAAHYFGMKLISIPVDPVTFRVRLDLVESAINKNTVCLVGSAPAFPQGIMDDIPSLGRLALKYQIGLHVDCCLGGFLMPFVKRLGYQPAYEFDFKVPGVTSISADTHKYGYAPKGSSVVLYSNNDLRSFQYFVAADWTGGIYASPSMPGSRPGGLIAATWAALVLNGEKGYLECAKAIMKAAKEIEAGIPKIDGLRVLGKPDMSIIAFATDDKSARGRELNIFKVGEAMSKHGWNLNSLQHPGSIHICCTYMHRDCAGKFLQNLSDSVKEVVEFPERFKNGSAAIYGMAESLPDTSLIDDVAKGYIDTLYKV